MKFFKKFILMGCLVVVSFCLDSMQAEAIEAPVNSREQMQLQIVDAFKSGGNSISVDMFGGKANGLSILHERGYKIPSTVFIEATDDLNIIDSDGFKKSLYKSISHLAVGDCYPVAVRSSCTNEDSFEESMAGHFDTIIGKMSFEEVLSNIKKVISGLSKTKGNKEKMGVIIQQKIDADYSGVIFSSNPFSYSKKEMLISYVPGIGDNLVSGDVTGTDVFVKAENENYDILSREKIPISDTLISLAKKTKELEKELNYPIDIEWAVINSELYFLQCRPLASITKIKTELKFVNKANMASLPKRLASHDKINLRLSTQDINVTSSDAYVFVRNDAFHKDLNLPVELKNSSYGVGNNAVIIYPQHMDGKVIRSFIGNKFNLSKNLPDCDKYVVNSYPKFGNINECLNEYHNMTKDDYWVTTTIIQEIFDPIYTGIVQKTENGYLIEVTYGNFITKGVVPTSQYLADFKGTVISKNEIFQNSWYQIVEGHVIFCSYSKDNNVLVSLSNNDVKHVIDLFDKLSRGSDIILEFGMLKNSEHDDMIPFLMDYVHNNSTSDISKTDIKEGIVSRGCVKGEIAYISDMNTNSIDTHFHDVNNENKQNSKNVVFFCKKPDIALLKLLQQYSSDKIGFVFQEGSLLCHFAVVLREKGIPAIKIGKDFTHFNDGELCVLDAETSGLVESERILICDN